MNSLWEHLTQLKGIRFLLLDVSYNNVPFFGHFPFFKNKSAGVQNMCCVRLLDKVTPTPKTRVELQPCLCSVSQDNQL